MVTMNSTRTTMTDRPEDDDATGDEDLVAYLDGELDATASQGVESRLAQDAQTRQKAQDYQKTYDLLDYLPKPEPSPNFASRTLTRIDAPAASKAAIPTAPTTGTAFNFSNASSIAVPSLPASKPWGLGTWAVLAAFALAVGYLAHLLAKPHLNAKPVQPLQQVRLLERLPLFAGVDDLNFARQLYEQELFIDHDYDPDASRIAMPAMESLTSAELAKLDESFRALPATRQQQLRQLDEDFAALDATMQQRLTSVLERYAVWLEHLPEDYRKEVLAAPAAAERIDTVRLVKNRIWRQHLPAVTRAKLDETAVKEDRDLILTDVRKQELQRRQEWESARSQWANAKSDRKPYPFEDDELAKRVEDYVNAVLKPRLNPFEFSRLDEIRKDTGQGGYLAWYLYGSAIVIAADAHPMLPEPKTGKPITRFDDLPADFQKKFNAAARQPGGILRLGLDKRQMKDMPQHGKWPDFAELIASESALRNVTPPPLGPARPGEFKPEVEDAITTLLGTLTPREKSDLEPKLGKWPDYSKLLVKLAREHDVEIPGVTLPGSTKEWQRVYVIRRRQ
jgi:hypothetical protein